MGVLDGIRIIEFAGIGPAPFCGMLLAAMGADVILVERSSAAPAIHSISARTPSSIAASDRLRSTSRMRARSKQYCD